MEVKVARPMNGGDRESLISVWKKEQTCTGVEVHLQREDNVKPLNLENGQISIITKEIAEEEKIVEEEKAVNGEDAEAFISVLEEQKFTGVEMRGENNEIPLNEENFQMTITKEEIVEEEKIAEEEKTMNGGDAESVITKEMVEEEKRLEEARLKHQGAEMEISIKSETIEMNDSMFSKLDELLNQTEMYTKFLLEKMDDMTSYAGADDNAQSTQGTNAKRSRKRKSTAVRNAARKQARIAVEAMLVSCKEEKTEEDSDNLTEEERLWKEQMELVPLLIGGRLRSYQMKGVKWMISLWQNGLNGILADQMGLGKTIQTIGFLAHLKGMGIHGPFLIVAPLSTLSNWVNEFNRFVPSMSVLLYHGSKKERAELRIKYMPVTMGPTFPVVITSYDVALNDYKVLARYKWKYLVVDEGHRLKNFNCKLLRHLKMLPVDNTLLLTGTPLHNNLGELWSLLNFILPQIFTSLREFESWFDFSGRQMNEAGNEETDDKKRVQVISKLHAILRPFLLRRLKEDVEKNLPLKKEIILYARMTEDQRKIQEHLLNKSLIPYLHARSEYGRAVKTSLDNLMIQLRKNFNHPDLLQSQFEISYHYPPVEKLMEQCGKFQLLDRLLKHLRARNHKVLIFSQWTRVLDLLDYCLSESGHNMCRIDGTVKLDDRQRQIKDFNDPNSKLHVFLLSTRAGGLGINLTAADTCIIYDSDWNPQMDLQAMDRCHRIGQTKPVHVYRLCTAHSAECRMLKVAFDKLKLERVVIEKGQFHQERTKSSFLKEHELLALLQQERDEEEELVQSDEISESNLLKLLDRSDMIKDSVKTSGTATDSLPLKGPGWEIIVRGGQVGGMLSSIEGYKQNDDENLKQE